MPDTTTEFGLRFPEPADPATIAQYFANLAQDVEDVLVGMNLDDLSVFFKTLLDDGDAATLLSSLGFSAFLQTVKDDADQNAVAATLGVLRDVNNVVQANHLADDVVGPAELADNAVTVAALGDLSALLQQDTQSASISANGVLTGISITPGAGTYLAFASADASYQGTAGAGTSVGLSLRVNGANVVNGPLAESVTGASGNVMALPVFAFGIITPAAGQAVEVYATFTGGTSKFVNSGRLILLGPLS